MQNSYDYYYIKCKKIYIYCQINHKYHDMINLSQFNYSIYSKKKLKKKIINIKKKKTRYYYLNKYIKIVKWIRNEIYGNIINCYV